MQEIENRSAPCDGFKSRVDAKNAYFRTALFEFGKKIDQGLKRAVCVETVELG